MMPHVLGKGELQGMEEPTGYMIGYMGFLEGSCKSVNRIQIEDLGMHAIHVKDY